VYIDAVRSFCLFALLLAACSDSGGNTTDDTGTGASSVPTGGDEDSGGNFDCATYCERITANCTGALAQYTNVQLCEATCGNFDVGEQSDVEGDTLGCRLYHAGAAKDDPATHCTHAGPGGNGQCGANCQGFCTIAVRACPAVYSDEAACESTCAGFSDAESYDASDVSGDTLACRLYHLTVATVYAADHCPHIAAVSETCK